MDFEKRDYSGIVALFKLTRDFPLHTVPSLQKMGDCTTRLRQNSQLLNFGPGILWDFCAQILRARNLCAARPTRAIWWRVAEASANSDPCFATDGPNLAMTSADLSDGYFCLYVEEEQVVRVPVCVWALRAFVLISAVLFISAVACVGGADQMVGEPD